MANVYTRTTTGGSHVDRWTFDTEGNGTAALHNGGPMVFGVGSGSTMGGGTVSWQWSPDGGTNWLNVGPSVTIATTSLEQITLPPGLFRPVLTGGAAWAITAWRA